MANFLFNKGLEGIGDRSIDLLGGTIKACLVTAAYTPVQATHEDLADVPAGAILATTAALTGKSVPNGIFDADDTVALAVSGSQITQILLFEESGSPATSRLIARMDTGTGLPFTPSGVDIPLQWDNGANKIFKL